MRQIVFLICSVLIFCMPLLAENATADQKKEDSIEDLFFMEIPNVITASKYEQSVNDAPDIVTVITEQEIKKFGANDLHDILNKVSSVYTIGQYLNVDGNTSIRGDLIFGQDLHVLLLLNGRPLRDAIGGYNMAFYEGFPIEMIERIEIVRGPGSVLYGTNAYVGVINIITKKPEGNNVKAAAGAGSFGTYLGSVVCNVKQGKLVVSGGVKYLDSSGWDFNAIDENGIAKSIDYSKHNVGFNASVEYDKLSVSIFGSTIKDACMGTIPIWPAETLYMVNDALFINVCYKQEFSESWNAQYNLGYTYTGLEFNTVPPTVIHKSKDYLGEATLFGRLSDKLNLVFGSVIEKKISPDNVSIQPLDQNTFSSYLQLDYSPLSFLKTTSGVQYNQPYNGYPGVVPRLGAIFNVSKDFGVKLFYAEAFRSPSLSELYIESPVLKGNPNLQAENIATSEIQLFYNKKQYQAALSYYNSRYYNIITRGPALPLPASYINSGSVNVDGVDLEGKASLMPTLNLIASYSFQENKNDRGIDDYMQISNHMAKIGVMYDFNTRISFGLFNQYYSKPADVSGVNPARLLVNPVPDAYNWVTLNVTYKASDRLEFTAYGANLLDQSVYYPEFGRKKINSLPGKPGTAMYFKISITL